MGVARAGDGPGRLGLSPNALGSLYMVIGSLGYVINDALVRAATDEGLDVYQSLFLRGVVISGLLAGAMAVRREPFDRRLLARPLVIRVVAEVVATATFFAALIRLDFANAQTILMLVPFAVTVVAAVALGERVTGRRYLAVVIGFVGVVAVVQPATSAFSPWSLVVIVSAAGLVVRDLATRSVDGDLSPLPVAFLTSVALTALTGAISIVSGWGRPTPGSIALLLAACGFLIVGYLFTIQTVRVGDLSVSAPFRYSTLVGAVAIGFFAFDERPNVLTLVGCALIVVAGVATTATGAPAGAQQRASVGSGHDQPRQL